jgi:ataxia telangiectasia mutated family protein
MFKEPADKNRTDMDIQRYPEGKAIVEKIPQLKIPPATLQIEVRSNCDYSDLPIITSWRSRMSIANGLSAPKVITAVGSDGKFYKQLVC